MRHGEHNNGPSYSIKGARFLEYDDGYEFLKEYSDPGNYSS
jgi:hypothetical protein